MIFQTDGELAMEVIRCLAAEVDMIPQESPEYDHAADGNAEMAVRELERQVRAVRFAAEAKFRR